MQQWLGHKHPAGTRYYAAILQRSLTASYKEADYFARNFRSRPAPGTGAQPPHIGKPRGRRP
ncbi:MULTISPECIES: hypothetical protein [unclassified Streptomyces]|uniref:hypothetical protein n=1 Tax=unclassified Streptomyces TaxID=2593676 RepID=UPI00159F0457|nr:MULTISPECIES: hypothetical protein [unclassified Streptomyces]